MILPHLLLALQLAAPADTTPHWRGEVTYGAEFHSRERRTWQTARTALGYRWSSGALIADLWTATRFGTWDQGGGLEGYFTLGRRLSAYAHAAVAPKATILPRSDLTGEVTLALGSGWGGSARYRRMAFPTERVNILGLGVERYAGRWYLRALGTIVPRTGATGLGLGLRARRYLDPADPDALVDFHADVGREVVIIAPDAPPELRSTASLGVRTQRHLGAAWGIALNLDWSHEERAPNRIGVGTTLFCTW